MLASFGPDLGLAWELLLAGRADGVALLPSALAGSGEGLRGTRTYEAELPMVAALQVVRENRAPLLALSLA